VPISGHNGKHNIHICTADHYSSKHDDTYDHWSYHNDSQQLLFAILR
jgi:hypothetical protein